MQGIGEGLTAVGAEDLHYRRLAAVQVSGDHLSTGQDGDCRHSGRERNLDEEAVPCIVWMLKDEILAGKHIPGNIFELQGVRQGCAGGTGDVGEDIAHRPGRIGKGTHGFDLGGLVVVHIPGDQQVPAGSGGHRHKLFNGRVLESLTGQGKCRGQAIPGDVRRPAGFSGSP